jgi:hypothetical protein
LTAHGRRRNFSVSEFHFDRGFAGAACAASPMLKAPRMIFVGSQAMELSHEVPMFAYDPLI